jgi:hypothetical protein
VPKIMSLIVYTFEELEPEVQEIVRADLVDTIIEEWEQQQRAAFEPKYDEGSESEGEFLERLRIGPSSEFIQEGMDAVFEVTLFNRVGQVVGIR